MPVLSLTEIKADLQRGLTRTPKDKNYNPEKGSIQEKYNLNSSQVAAVFKHPELKGLRTRVESDEIVFVEEIQDLPEAELTEDMKASIAARAQAISGALSSSETVIEFEQAPQTAVVDIETPTSEDQFDF